MSKKKHLFFTSKHCGGCQEIKKILDRDGVNQDNVVEVDCDTEKGSKLADEHKIEYTPTLIKDGKHYVGEHVVCALKNKC
jgi:glutaredoxin